MRFLLANNHCITDPTTGVTQSLRTIVTWLADAGHTCHILTTARLEAGATLSIDEHLRSLGVDPPRRRGAVPMVEYEAGRIPITLLMTRHNDESRPHKGEAAQYLEEVDRLLRGFAPDHLIACNGHPMMFEALAHARRRGVTTSFAIRSFGYEDPACFADVDHAFTCSQFLTDAYRARIGLTSTPLEPPIDWSAVVAPVESRAFLTFVNPSPHKGLWLFARLADMLGSRRPDLPILVVQSAKGGGALNTIPGVDFSKYPQIMAAPPVATPADYFALTRVLLVPSVWEEPFGRVAAEAMVNAIPPVVSNRGGLPHAVGGDFDAGGGGRVLAVPAWMTTHTARLPSEEEIEPWYAAICALWDDAGLYHAVATRAHAIANQRYSEAVSRRAHVDYFTSLTPRRGAIVEPIAR